MKRCQHCTDARPAGLVGRMPAVPVTLRLTHAQLETAQRLANKSGIRYQTLLKRLIGDLLGSFERAARLKHWE